MKKRFKIMEEKMIEFISYNGKLKKYKKNDLVNENVNPSCCSGCC